MEKIEGTGFMSLINEHVLEIRYKANPKILDFRGAWAEGISNHMDLKHWRILENRVDVFNDNSSLHAFVGFKSAGFVAQDTDTKDFFSNKAVKYFKYLFSLDGFGLDIYVRRIGVRARFAQEYKNSFEDLMTKYSQNYLRLTEEAKKAINAELVDIGGPLNFKDKEGNFNTMSGPMKSEQLQNLLDGREKLPEVSFYYDIDYWITPDKILNEREIIRTVKAFSLSTWERFSATSKIVLGVE
jgi:hypothetical protein